MSYEIEPCPICQYNSMVSNEFPDNDGDIVVRVKCIRCGTYKMEHRAVAALPKHISGDKRLLVSSLIADFSNKDYTIMYNDLDKLASHAKIPQFIERADRLLLFLGEKYPKINTSIPWQDIVNILTLMTKFRESDLANSNIQLSVQLMAKSWCEDISELEFLLYDYLYKTQEYLTEKRIGELTITAAGWKRIYELKTEVREGNIGFIAMKFEEKLIKYSKKWFETAIGETGHDCKVMYSHQHTKVIDNEMKALIRRSKFVVCDLTENSRGAYYEAGFAHGLGIPVIFLCESEFFHKKENELGEESPGVHFDTNHYPFIEWKFDEGEKLKKDLRDWIEGTIGRGLKDGV